MAKLGCGEVCWGSCLDSSDSRLDATLEEMRSSSNHRTCVTIEIDNVLTAQDLFLFLIFFGICQYPVGLFSRIKACAIWHLGIFAAIYPEDCLDIDATG